MTIHRSAMGRTIDMSALTAKNEKTRAVGNMNVNARGDIIDSHNRVIQDNTQRVKANYQTSVQETTPDHLATNRHVVDVVQVIQPDEPVDLSEAEKKMFEELDEEDDEK